MNTVEKRKTEVQKQTTRAKSQIKSQVSCCVLRANRARRPTELSGARARAHQSVVSASTFSILALSPSASRFISSSLPCSAVVAAGLAASAAAISSGADSSIRRSAMAASPHDGSSLSSRPYKRPWGVGKGRC